MWNVLQLTRAAAAALVDRLGRCPKCTHTSFLSAIAAIAVVFGLWLAAAPPVVLVLGLAACLSLGLLWMSHVWMFTLRSARATARLTSVTDGEQDPWTRRRLLGAFLRVLVFSAVASGLPRGLRAQSCNCYTESNCYCPPDFPQCIFNPSTGEAICCGPNAVGCAGPNSTWCCPPGSNCYGTNNQCI